MEKNILIINGSPRKNGNTAELLSWIKEGVERTGTHTRTIHLVDFNIQYCRGCFACVKTGFCAITDDDVTEIFTMIHNADGTIVGSPVYEGLPAAILTTLMDRIALFALYYGIFDEKKSFGAATSGIAPAKGVANKAAELFGTRQGRIVVNTAGISGAYLPVTADNYPKKAEQARKAGEKFVQKLNTGKKPLKYYWIQFLRKNFLKKLLLANPEQFAGVIKSWKERGWM